MWPVTRGGARWRLALAVVVAAALLGSCADGTAEAEQRAVATDPTRTGTPTAGVTISSRMDEEPSHWREAQLDGDARLEYTGGRYRMTVGAWPLVSPSMDPRAADLDPVAVEATIRPVSGDGLFGVACAVTARTAYVFVVGDHASGKPYYAIAELSDGEARALVDSSAPGATDASQVVERAAATSVGGRCRSGPTPGTAVLELVVGDDVVLDAVVPDAAPRGQVGLVAVSRPGGSLVVDVVDVTIRGPS